MSRRRRQSKEKPRKPSSSHPSRSSSSTWERFWFGPVAAVRPYLLMKAVLLVLAFDVWLVRVPRGWKFGVDGFNVAHFQWLDWLQPLPVPGLYVGVQLLVGIVALVCAFTEAGLWLRILLASLHTYSWAMSLLDNYQHHYFLSLALGAFIFFPRIRGLDLYPAKVDRAAERGEGANAAAGRGNISSWAYVLLGVTIAIIYFFTAINKLEPGWRAELMIGELARDQKLLAPVESWFADAGVAREQFWQWMALSVFTVEIFLGASYLLAVRQDGERRLLRSVLGVLAFVAALVFHGIVNEVFLALRIGWFSFYMMALAGIYLLPASMLWRVGEVVTWPGRRVASYAHPLLASLNTAPKLSMTLTVAGSLVMIILSGAVGLALDLPGASNVGFLTAFALLGILLFALARRGHRDAVRYIVAAGLANLFLCLTVTQSTVRFDYYNSVGAHLRERNNLRAAAEADEKARRYLPRGKKPSQE